MGQPEAARFQLLVVDHHPSIFHVKDLHDVSTAVDENKHPATSNILSHRLIDYAAQGIKAFTHIYRHRVQVVFKGFMEMEHTINLKDKQGCVDGLNPYLALSEAVSRWDILIQLAFLHRYSQLHEPRVGRLHNPVPELRVKVLQPGE